MGLIDSDALLGLLNAEHRSYSVIANNLANVETPGYRTARMRFADELERLVDGNGRLRAGAEIRSEIYRPMYGNTSADGNDVMLEREMVELGKNQLRMRLYLSVLGARIRRLRSAIDGQ